MTRNLTIEIDEDILRKAEKFAERRNLSLSEFVAQYLSTILETVEMDEKQAAFAQLAGILHLPNDFDEKKEYREYRAKRVINA